MVAPFTLALASLDLITTDCRSPFVFKARLAENAGPLATTSMRSPSAVPVIFPATFRLDSLQLPLTAFDAKVALARMSKL